MERVFLTLKNDGLQPLILISQACYLLLDEYLGPLTDEQREQLEMISRSCVEAKDGWNIPAMCLYLLDEIPPAFWEGRRLDEILERAMIYFRAKITLPPPAYQIPPVLPLLKYHFFLPEVICALLTIQLWEGSTASTIEIAQETSTCVSLRFWRHVGDVQYGQYPGSPLATAALFFQRYGSELELLPRDGGTEFVLRLLAWEGGAE